MLLAQAATVATGLDWAQFGIAGAMLGVMSAYIWHLTKQNREIADNNNATNEKVATANNETSEKITDKFIELQKESNATSVELHKLHNQALEQIRQQGRQA